MRSIRVEQPVDARKYWLGLHFAVMPGRMKSFFRDNIRQGRLRVPVRLRSGVAMPQKQLHHALVPLERESHFPTNNRLCRRDETFAMAPRSQPHWFRTDFTLFYARRVSVNFLGFIARLSTEMNRQVTAPLSNQQMSCFGPAFSNHSVMPVLEAANLGRTWQCLSLSGQVSHLPQ